MNAFTMWQEVGLAFNVLITTWMLLTIKKRKSWQDLNQEMFIISQNKKNKVRQAPGRRVKIVGFVSLDFYVGSVLRCKEALQEISK